MEQTWMTLVNIPRLFHEDQQDYDEMCCWGVSGRG
jgi:hypothetical protein